MALNFQNNDEFEQSLDILAPFGRMIDTAAERQSHIVSINKRVSVKCIEYAMVNLSQIRKHRPQLLQRLLVQLSDWIQAGKIRQTSAPSLYKANEIPMALQAFAHVQPISSFVIDFSPGQSVEVSHMSILLQTILELTSGIDSSY